MRRFVRLCLIRHNKRHPATHVLSRQRQRARKRTFYVCSTFVLGLLLSIPAAFFFDGQSAYAQGPLLQQIGQCDVGNNTCNSSISSATTSGELTIGIVAMNGGVEGTQVPYMDSESSTETWVLLSSTGLTNSYASMAIYYTTSTGWTAFRGWCPGASYCGAQIMVFSGVTAAELDQASGGIGSQASSSFVNTPVNSTYSSEFFVTAMDGPQSGNPSGSASPCTWNEADTLNEGSCWGYTSASGSQNVTWAYSSSVTTFSFVYASFDVNSSGGTPGSGGTTTTTTTSSSGVSCPSSSPCYVTSASTTSTTFPTLVTVNTAAPVTAVTVCPSSSPCYVTSASTTSTTFPTKVTVTGTVAISGTVPVSEVGTVPISGTVAISGTVPVSEVGTVPVSIVTGTTASTTSTTVCGGTAAPCYVASSTTTTTLDSDGGTTPLTGSSTSTGCDWYDPVCWFSFLWEPNSSHVASLTSAIGDSGVSSLSSGVSTDVSDVGNILTDSGGSIEYGGVEGLYCIGDTGVAPVGNPTGNNFAWNVSGMLGGYIGAFGGPSDLCWYQNQVDPLLSGADSGGNDVLGLIKDLIDAGLVVLTIIGAINIINRAFASGK